MSLSKRRGFTLIELLVTIGIIILLAALIIVNVAQARQNGRDTKRISDLKSIQTALEMNFEKSKSYPIQTSWVNVSDINTADLDNLKIYINPVPNDPLNGKSGIEIVSPTAADPDNCNLKSTASNMAYQYISDADGSGSNYKIIALLETRCEGLDKNDGGTKNNMYELWGGKDGRDL